MQDRHDLARLFAEILEYPREGLPATARRAEGLLWEVAPDACVAMAEFAAFVEGERLDRLEEIYTSAFDLNPQCYPYAGYQLFGDDPKRTQLMVRLQQWFSAAGFDPGCELPDHVPLLLRFLSELKDGEEARELRQLVLSPTLAKMSQTLEEKKNPYARAVAAAAAIVGER